MDKILIEKVKKLHAKKTFPTEILFNGKCFDSGYKTFTECEMNDMKREFDRFIKENVLLCQTSIIEAVLNFSDERPFDTPFNSGDVYNLNGFNKDEAIDAIIEEKPNERNLRKNLETMSNEEIIDYIQSNCSFDEYEFEYQVEVYEWWFVSNWLVQELNEQHEVVIDGYEIWGRACSGQSVKLDSVLHDIFIRYWL